MGAIDLGYRVIIVADAICSGADSTHDAMLAIYESRFGMQVQTISTPDLLTARLTACSNRNIHAMSEQEKIIDALGVASSFDVANEANRRITFLADYLRSSGLRSYVLGISGGVDSSWLRFWLNKPQRTFEQPVTTPSL